MYPSVLFVKQAAEYLKGRLPVCTVIGFPNGYDTTAVKVYETAEAVENGAMRSTWSSTWAGSRTACTTGWVLEEINAVKKPVPAAF